MWITYGENITFWTQFPNKNLKKKKIRKGKRVYLCESRMEIEVGQIDGLDAFDDDRRLRISVKKVQLRGGQVPEIRTHVGIILPVVEPNSLVAFQHIDDTNQALVPNFKINKRLLYWWSILFYWLWYSSSYPSAPCYIKGKIGKISIILCACVCTYVKGFFQITATTSNPCKLYCSLVLGCWHGILTEE